MLKYPSLMLAVGAMVWACGGSTEPSSERASGDAGKSGSSGKAGAAGSGQPDGSAGVSGSSGTGTGAAQRAALEPAAAETEAPEPVVAEPEAPEPAAPGRRAVLPARPAAQVAWAALLELPAPEARPERRRASARTRVSADSSRIVVRAWRSVRTSPN